MEHGGQDLPILWRHVFVEPTRSQSRKSIPMSPERPAVVMACSVVFARAGTIGPNAISIGLFTFLLALCLMLAPSPYVVESPGPTENVLGKADGKEVATTYPDRGELLLTTVNASGVPGYPISNIWALIGWLDHMNVLPSEAVFPVGQSSEEYDQEAKADMTSSMEAAAGLAYEEAGSQGVRCRRLNAHRRH